MKDFKENIFGNTQNKSMFNYITDISSYENKNECSNFTPPFLSYIPVGVPPKNIDIDSVLKGTNQYLSKCTEYKYREGDKIDLKDVKIKKECEKESNIIKDGYMPFDKYAIKKN
jgi:hypothetical protein